MAWPLLGEAQEKARFTELREALAATAILSGRPGPQNVDWSHGGGRFAFITMAKDGGREVRMYDTRTDADTLLLDACGLTFPSTDEPFEYTSFQWTEERGHLVFQTRFQPLYRRSGIADYYLYRLSDGSLELAAHGARTAELSPDGRLLGFGREGELFVYDVETGRQRQLTRGASETVFNGHFDWDYENEFGLGQAWKWSPDSRYVAYWQVDESAVPVAQFSDFEGWRARWLRMRIPKPGDPTAQVRIGIVDVQNGRNIWLDPRESDEHYVPRVYWTSRPDT
jgi:dipeptidyl-peptidase-4